MIRIENADKSFKETKVFENMNFIVDKPGLYVIQGESGSGKSTLLNLLAGYEAFDNGNIHIDTNIATIFQNYELIESLTVEENIFLKNHRPTKDELEMIHMLGLQELLNHRCNELSGGQMQRVGIARALMLDPNMILCDEPTESLDVENKIVVMELLKKLSKHKVVILASHDQKLIDEYADTIYQIVDYKLIPYKISHETNQFVKSEKKKIDVKHVSNLIHKLLWKKSLVFSMVITAVILISLGLYIFQKSLFYLPNTTNVVNADTVYIKVNDEKINLGEFQIQEDKVDRIVSFVNVHMKDKEVLSNIFPYVDNELVIEGKEPGNDEIVINQNVASQLEGFIGQKLDFVFIIDNSRITKTYTICGVVNESDTLSYNFYYDLDCLYEDLKSLYKSDGENYYDYLMREGRYFQYSTVYENVSALYGRVAKEKNITITSPLYEERMEFDQKSAIYRILFLIFEGMVLLSVAFLIVVYLTIDGKQYMRVSSILVSMQIPIDLVQKQYIKYKLLSFVPMCLFSVGIGIGMYYLMYGFEYISAMDYINNIVIALFMITLYVIVLVVNLKKFKQRNISEILKDSKD